MQEEETNEHVTTKERKYEAGEQQNPCQLQENMNMKTTPSHEMITKERKQENMNTKRKNETPHQLQENMSVKRNSTENETSKHPALALGEHECQEHCINNNEKPRVPHQ